MFQTVACAWSATLAVSEDGSSVLAFGRGTEGQLGNGTREHQRTPARVAGLEGECDIVMVAAGYEHSAALTSEGRLLLWGGNHFGQVGQGDREDRLVPVRLGPPHFGRAPVAMVACGAGHTLVVTRAGRLYAFGRGDNGQLGLGDRNDRDVPVEVVPARFGGAFITQAAAGDAHSGAVTMGGAVWTWGSGLHGCLGHNGEQDELEPKELRGQFGGARVSTVTTALNYTMVLTTCGAVWGCGAGDYGQLGVGDTADRHVPVLVGDNKAFGQSKVRMVACGNCHTMAVTEEGAVWSWGHGSFAQLGHNDCNERLEPKKVAQACFGGARIDVIACGLHHSVAVSEDGGLYTWGASDVFGWPNGLGHEDTQDKIAPALVDPELLHGVRISRGPLLAPDLALAFAMGTTERLGEESPIAHLSPELVELVINCTACRISC